MDLHQILYTTSLKGILDPFGNDIPLPDKPDKDSNFKWFSSYRPRRSCGKVMFLHLSFCSRGGVSASGPRQTPPWQTPPGRHPPWADTHCPVHAGIHTPCPVHAGIHPASPVQCMLGYGQQAGGTYPTGMHTCFYLILADLILLRCLFI